MNPIPAKIQLKMGLKEIEPARLPMLSKIPYQTKIMRGIPVIRREGMGGFKANSRCNYQYISLTLRVIMKCGTRFGFHRNLMR